jgi:hypothetical protein
MKPPIKRVAAESSDRDEARRASVAACRALEAALVEALTQAGDRLRGLPDLGARGAMFRAARVRGAPANPLDIPGGSAGHPRLCLDDHGRLVMARLVRASGALAVQWEAAKDADLLAEDAQALSECLDAVIEDHLTAVDRARERYAGLRRIAEVVTAALRGGG